MLQIQVVQLFCESIEVDCANLVEVKALSIWRSKEIVLYLRCQINY